MKRDTFFGKPVFWGLKKLLKKEFHHVMSNHDSFTWPEIVYICHKMFYLIFPPYYMPSVII